MKTTTRHDDLPTPAELDVMTDEEADAWLDRLWQAKPDVVEAVEAITLIASPLAGPVRILREVIKEGASDA